MSVESPSSPPPRTPDAAAPPPAASLVSGALWTMGATGISYLLALVANVVVARKLGPELFGVFGMANIVLAFAANFQGLGFLPAIAAGRMRESHTLGAAHWLLVAAGVLFAAVLWALAGSVARFFGNEQVAWVLRVASLVLLLSSSGAVPQALLQHEGRFRLLGSLAILSQLVAALIAMTLALSGAGVWSLVCPQLAAALVSTVGAWRFVSWRPSGRPRWDAARAFHREGSELTGFQVLNYFARNADNAIVGRFFGEASLGLYSFAYDLLMRPLTLLSHSVTRVLVPQFGRTRADLPRLDRLVVESVQAVLRLGSPLMVGGALTAHLFVPLLWGPKWIAAIDLVQVFMLVGAVQLVGPLFGALSMALGRSTVMVAWGAITAVLIVGCFAGGALLGGVSVMARAYLALNLVLVVMMYTIARGLYGLKLVGLPRRCMVVLRDLVLMSAAVLGTEVGLFRLDAPPALRLVLEVVAGGLVYTLALRMLSPHETEGLVAAAPAKVRRWLQVGLRLHSGT